MAASSKIDAHTVLSLLEKLYLAALLLRPLAALAAHPWPGSITNGASPQCHQIHFNVTNGDPPALVFNPAMAYDASAGWVVFANAAQCHFWRCGLGHHTPLGALAGSRALPDLQAAAASAELWSLDTSGFDFAGQCPHLLADGNTSACGAPARAGEAGLLALHAEDFRFAGCVFCFAWVGMGQHPRSTSPHIPVPLPIFSGVVDAYSRPLFACPP